MWWGPHRSHTGAALIGALLRDESADHHQSSEARGLKGISLSRAISSFGAHTAISAPAAEPSPFKTVFSFPLQFKQLLNLKLKDYILFIYSRNTLIATERFRTGMQ